ncbi:MAG TPA: amino acid aminotransferase [Kiritimatiellia bacterium]|nr:amino acid aminotransferase [Kiritimatiellia bacterium]
MFEHLTSAPPDAILGLTEAWKKDPNPLKVNLGVGIYKDNQGQTPVLESVKTAEARILASASSKSYMPIGGQPEYGRMVQDLILGEEHPAISEGRIRTAHTPGGTGGLRVGADFLKKVKGNATVWVSRPTWANHKGIFEAAGFTVKEYSYYDSATRGLDFDGMSADLDKIPEGDIVVLHVCCHNPSGVDLTDEQWSQVSEIAAKRKWMPFLDFAYQGFGAGIEEDRAGLLAMVKSCPELLVSSSFSKNFGLYQDRTGALSLIAANRTNAETAFSHVEIAIRVNYSNPPAHGGLIVSAILSDEILKTQWLEELSAMRHRIADVRSQFVLALKNQGIKTDFSFIERQKGMFSFSGLTDDQVAFLREKKSIYIVKGGRINVAGITSQNIGYLCGSIAEVMG